MAKEVEDSNETGHDFDVDSSIVAQIPFFACFNIFFDKRIQRDIKRYIYCQDLGVSPYKGHMGEHPSQWVDNFFSIKKSFAKHEKQEIEKRKNK